MVAYENTYEDAAATRIQTHVRGRQGRQQVQKRHKASSRTYANSVMPPQQAASTPCGPTVRLPLPSLPSPPFRTLNTPLAPLGRVNGRPPRPSKQAHVGGESGRNCTTCIKMRRSFRLVCEDRPVFARPVA